MILRKIILNAFSITFVAIIAFFVHMLINNSLSSPISYAQLTYSYIINILLALGVIVLLYALRKKLKDQLGFLFMLGSMLKFVFFFLFFYPEYTSDGVLSRYEFFTFFIPYVICLVMESVILSRFLNRLDTDD